MANDRAQLGIAGSGRTTTATLLLAGLAAAAIPGCGMFHSTAPAPHEPGPATASANSADEATSTKVAAAPDATAVPASAGTDAWINPQARQESGQDNVTATFNLQQITFAQEGADFDPAISRDGSKVVFASTQHRPTADLYVKTITGRTITQLTNDPAEDGTPDISPDGARVAFASNRNGNWDIYIIPITGGKAIQVTSDESDELHPSWSPDGTQLVFSRMGPTSGRWEMWVTDAAKAANATFIGYGLFPRWCPTPGTGADGSDRIVFQLGRERGQRSFAIWTIDFKDAQASNPTQIASSPSAALINPTWSPDGRFIVYSSVPSAEAWPSAGSGGPPAAELWLASVTADSEVQLTTPDLRAIRPAWGSANRLYFVSNRNSSENIWSIDLAQSLASIGGTVSGPEGSTTASAGSKASPTGLANRAPQTRTASADRPGKAPTKTATGSKPAKEAPEQAPAGQDQQPSSSTADAGDENQRP